MNTNLHKAKQAKNDEFYTEEQKKKNKEEWAKFYRNNPEFLSMNCFGVELNKIERRIIHYILSKAIERKGEI